MNLEPIPNFVNLKSYVEYINKEIFDKLTIPFDFFVSKNDKERDSQDIVEAIEFILSGKNDNYINVVMKEVVNKMEVLK